VIPGDVEELRELRDEAERGARRIDVRPTGWRWIAPPDDDDQGGDAGVFNSAPPEDAASAE
jgi:hypothetical protein